jgi:divalent metal cation (Fe/Co/Zn/Cd) transporter
MSVCEGIVSMQSPSPLGDPTWNRVVLALSAVFEGLSWRVSRRELERCRRSGESLWRAALHSMDVLVFTVFVEDSAALMTGIVIATCGVWLSHHFDNPFFDPAASVAIGLVLIGAAALLVRKSARLLVGESLDAGQIAQLRQIIAADPAVECVHHLLSMQLGPDKVLLTAAVRFERRFDLDAVEQAIDRLEQAIKLHYPSIRQLFLESGALKGLSTSHRQARAAGAPEAPDAAAAPPSPT